jgi:hypothetical protein
MWHESSPHPEEVERHVHLRTGRRVRDLTVVIEGGRIVLRGRAGSYYVKQLAQHSARELMPDAPLDNAICVEPGQEPPQA